MNENLKKFLEEASKNEELKAKLTALTDKDTAAAKAVELAKEYGFALTAEDFQPAGNEELSLDELNAVSGGWVMTCGMTQIHDYTVSGSDNPVVIHCYTTGDENDHIDECKRFAV